MPKRRPTAKSPGSIKSTDATSPETSVLPSQALQPIRPPLPNTSRTYGKVTGGKAGKPLAPKAFSHRKRG